MSDLSDRVAALLPLPPRDYLILFALVDGGRHGHGILKALEAQAGSVMIDPANLYRTLRKMDRDGLIVEELRGSRRAESRRRVYSLTPLGRAALKAEAARMALLTDSARGRKLVPSSSGIK
ncbi:MAG: PadR family transcriptional regulator [Vicinamibacterales bacterium]